MSNWRLTGNRMKSVIGSFKRFFLRGLGTLLPTLLTLIIIIKLVGFVYDNFGRYIGVGLTRAIGLASKEFCYPTVTEIEKYLKDRHLSRTDLTDEEYKEIVKLLRQRKLYRLGRSWQMALIGFFVALTLIWVLGVFLASIIGRKLWQYVESTMMKIPGIRQIYPYVKQVTDYLFGEKKLEFSRVVAIPYPRKGIWSVGFVTGPAIKTLDKLTEDGRGCITVFVPTSPTPLTGFIVTVPKSEVIDLPFTIEQAFRFIISGGVILPETTPTLPELINSGEQGKES